MLPGFKAFKLYKGDTFAFNLTLGSGGDPYDISTHTFRGQIKEKGKKTLVASFDYDIVDGPAGELRIILSADEASKLNGAKIYEYDIEMNQDGVVSTILKGPITVMSDISN